MSPEAALLVSQANRLFLFCTETAAAVQRRVTEYRDNNARAIPEQQRWYSAEHSVPAVLPLSVMFYGRPFSEPMLFRIASAYENATHHRTPPPDFGPVRPASVSTAAVRVKDKTP